ncbi:MAG: hypothetical protein COB56_05490 [Robiginitomaculum sp.]|nr:MAG: hypothetical protein COB56_05490 [Robiginitomaculum sp.]
MSKKQQEYEEYAEKIWLVQRYRITTLITIVVTLVGLVITVIMFSAMPEPWAIMKEPISSKDYVKLFAAILVAMATLLSTSIFMRRIIRRSTLSDRELEGEYDREQISIIRKKIEKEKDAETAGLLRVQELELRQKLKQSFSDNLCDSDGNLLNDWREPLLMSRRRLLEEGRRLSARSSSNLSWGILISFIVVVFLGILIFVIKPNGDLEDSYSFWAYYGPRFSLVVILQILASFFLRNFIRVEREIQRNKNEITNLELRLAAGLIAGSDKKKLSELANSLIQEEQNFVLAKRETSALSTDKYIMKQALDLAKNAIDKATK